MTTLVAVPGPGHHHENLEEEFWAEAAHKERIEDEEQKGNVTDEGETESIFGVVQETVIVAKLDCTQTFISTRCYIPCRSMCLQCVFLQCVTAGELEADWLSEVGLGEWTQQWRQGKSLPENDIGPAVQKLSLKPHQV